MRLLPYGGHSQITKLFPEVLNRVQTHNGSDEESYPFDAVRLRLMSIALSQNQNQLTLSHSQSRYPSG